MTAPLTYMVTGGAGLVGSRLTDALLAQGHTVVVLDDLSTGGRANLAAAWPSPRLRFVRGSALDARLVAELAGRCDAVVHLAAVGAGPVAEAAHRLGRRLLIVSDEDGYGDWGGDVGDTVDALLRLLAEPAAQPAAAGV
ncbi:NAD-dependent epimerase/dehydratase family protein [Streptomyces sp. NPDC002790]|uniref:NAD-dependent epimerase/dehydratase family protein n=1 Tax=Streptomyces sp. NPDC002790 TaxID=3154431 RepID=UPI00332DC249